MHDPSTAVVRQWARERGMAVGDRGRLSPDLVAAYLADQAPSARAAPADERKPPPSRADTRGRDGRPSGGTVVRARTPWNWPQLEGQGKPRPRRRGGSA